MTTRAKPNSLAFILSELRIENKCRCCRCKKIKPINSFNNHNLNKKYPYCNDCKKLSGIKGNLKRQFNLSIDEYNILHEKQKGLCAICNEPETFINCHTKTVILLAVDHCHLTGSIRGLLCRHCNLMIGNAKDSSKILRQAANYVDNPPPPLPLLLEKIK